MITSSLISCGQTINEKIEISFLRYETNPNSPNSHYLFFCLENNSSDTLYVSENQISIVVTNKNLIVKENISFGGFPPPINDKRFLPNECRDDEKSLKMEEKMKIKFGINLLKKTFSENRLSKQEKENAIQMIKASCIVLLPKSKTSFQRFFMSKNFEKFYKVKATLIEDKEFCSFYDKKGNLLKIFNNP